MRCSVLLVFISFVGLVIRQKALAQLLEPECGLSGIMSKIMGGTDAVHGASPWMAYLYQNENDFLCGGSLIHKWFVLTAAHCIVKKDHLTVRLGEYSSDSRASSSIVYNVALAIRNRLHSKHTHEHDIGMLKLDREVQFNAYIRPVCIFTDTSQLPNVTTYTVTGWGTTSTSRIANVLQTLELQDESPSRCYEHMRVHLGPGQICAAHSAGDTSSGDSGGPLVHLVNVGGTSRYLQFGIVSFGTRGLIGPGVYTRVHFYVDWILRAVRYGLTH